jgi:hypothetical protein
MSRRPWHFDSGGETLPVVHCSTQNDLLAISVSLRQVPPSVFLHRSSFAIDAEHSVVQRPLGGPAPGVTLSVGLTQVSPPLQSLSLLQLVPSTLDPASPPPSFGGAPQLGDKHERTVMGSRQGVGVPIHWPEVAQTGRPLTDLLTMVEQSRSNSTPFCVTLLHPETTAIVEQADEESPPPPPPPPPPSAVLLGGPSSAPQPTATTKHPIRSPRLAPAHRLVDIEESPFFR